MSADKPALPAIDVKDQADLMKHFTAALSQEIQMADQIMLPILKDMATAVRDTRMTLGRETQHILSHMQQLNQMRKYTDDIIAFVRAVEQLTALLTPERVAILRQVLGITAPVEEGK